MNSIMNTIKSNGNDIIVDNNFLFVAFQNRLLSRIVHIFEKHKIPVNKNIIKKKMEEDLINHLTDVNEETIEKYIELLSKYESIIINYVSKNTNTQTIKKATMSFIQQISRKNKSNLTPQIATNFIENTKSMIFVYDCIELNHEVIDRIIIDVKEIVEEFNRNNYNFVIESINTIIKNIIKNM